MGQQTLKTALAFALSLALLFCGSHEAQSEPCPPYEDQNDIVEGTGNTTPPGSDVKLTDDTNKPWLDQSYFEEDTSTEPVKESSPGQTQTTTSGPTSDSDTTTPSYFDESASTEPVRESTPESTPANSSYFDSDSVIDHVTDTGQGETVGGIPLYVPVSPGPGHIIRPFNTGVIHPVKPTHVHVRPTRIHVAPVKPTHVHVQPTRRLPPQGGPINLQTVGGYKPPNTGKAVQPTRRLPPQPVRIETSRQWAPEVQQALPVAAQGVYTFVSTGRYKPPNTGKSVRGFQGTKVIKDRVRVRNQPAAVKNYSQPVRRVRTPVYNPQPIRRVQPPVRRRIR